MFLLRYMLFCHTRFSSEKIKGSLELQEVDADNGIEMLYTLYLLCKNTLKN